MVFHTVTMMVVMVVMILMVFIISHVVVLTGNVRAYGVHSPDRAKCIPRPRMFVGKI